MIFHINESMNDVNINITPNYCFSFNKAIAQTSCQRAFVKLIQFVIIMGSKFMHGLIKNIKSE